jgi:hypothetical protein
LNLFEFSGADDRLSELHGRNSIIGNDKLAMVRALAFQRRRFEQPAPLGL